MKALVSGSSVTYLLPLLDGLDEVPTDMQLDCVEAINAFIEDLNPSGLVICSRLYEYRWLSKRMKLNGAICLEPISEDGVAEYLATGGSKLDALREAVHIDPMLKELTEIPLMLSIMSLAFQGASGNELGSQKGDSLEDRRNQIIRLYISEVFRRKGETSLDFTKDKTIGWLSWLARRMREHSQSHFFVEELEAELVKQRSQTSTIWHRRHPDFQVDSRAGFRAILFAKQWVDSEFIYFDYSWVRLLSGAPEESVTRGSIARRSLSKMSIT